MIQWPDQATQAVESWEREKKSKRYRYWSMLRSARTEYFSLVGQAAEYEGWSEGGFNYYLKQQYGLQVTMIDGKIAGEYAVIDEKKYLFFLIKFGS